MFRPSFKVLSIELRAANDFLDFGFCQLQKQNAMRISIAYGVFDARFFT